MSDTVSPAFRSVQVLWVSGGSQARGTGPGAKAPPERGIFSRFHVSICIGVMDMLAGAYLPDGGGKL